MSDHTASKITDVSFGDLLETGKGPAPVQGATDRLDDLAQIIGAYNRVTKNLQQSHESLRSQVVQLQQELASSDAQLQRSKRLAALGGMAAGIAHEIRNPLAAIQLYTDMMVDDLGGVCVSQDKAQQAYGCAKKIASAVAGLNAIVTDVLSFSREIKPKPIVVAVDHLIDRALEAYQPTIEQAGIQVQRLGRCLSGAHDQVMVCVDADLLHQALLNLIRNAAEAMSDQGLTGPSDKPRVLTIGAKQISGLVVLSIRDTGHGIADLQIDRIFNPFFTTRDCGTGLGLAIVHRIIDAHQGTISVHNDQGAVFELSLPVHNQNKPVSSNAKELYFDHGAQLEPAVALAGGGCVVHQS